MKKNIQETKNIMDSTKNQDEIEISKKQLALLEMQYKNLQEDLSEVNLRNKLNEKINELNIIEKEEYNINKKNKPETKMDNKDKKRKITEEINNLKKL